MATTLQASVVVSLFVSTVTAFGVFFIRAPGWERLDGLALGLLLISMSLWLVSRLGYLRVVAYGMVIGYSGLALYGALSGVGVRGTGYAAFSINVMLAALFIHRRAGYIVAALATLLGLGIVGANQAGLLPNFDQPLTEMTVWLNISIYFFISAVILDITLRQVDYALQEQHRAEEDLRRSNAELEAANRELQDFTYTLAHDLRAPARAMIGFSRLLMEEHAGQLSVNGAHYLKQVNHGAQRMGQMIDELLAFTHLGRQVPRKEPVNMLALVHHVLDELQSTQWGRQVEVTIGRLPDAKADAEMLAQVWRHLLSNAFKFTRTVENAKIRLGSLEKDGVCYYVRDNGVGLDMQYANKLFGVFQRLHLEEEYEGTGMGLAMAQRILQRHGGHIWVEAEVGKGAAFYFTLGPQ